MDTAKKSASGSLLIILAALCWSSMGVFTRNFNSIGLYAMEITQLRVTTAFIAVGLVLLFSDPTNIRFKLKDLWCFLGTGICSLLMYCLCYFKALETTDISVVTVLAYLSPVYIMLMSTFLFKEKLSRRKILALCVAVAGCALVSGIFGGFHGNVTGLLLGFASGFFYALYSIFTKFAILRGYQTSTILFYTFGFSAVGVSFFCDWNTLAETVSSSFETAVLSLIFGAVTCCVPYALYSAGIRRIEISKASILNCADVVFSSAFGALLFQEYPSWIAIVGICLILASVVILSMKEKVKK